MPPENQNPQAPSRDQLDFIKLDQITVSDRAPNAKDKGLFWIKRPKADNGTITFYLRHSISGVWYGKDWP